MNKCRICLNNNAKLYICNDCKNKLKKTNSSKYLCLYEYNNFAKEIIYRLKYSNDIEISKIFTTKLNFLKIRYATYKWIAVPNSKSQRKQRGLDVNSELLNKCGIKHYNLHLRIDDKITSKNHKNSIKQLKFKKISNIKKGKKIIIFDDIITTGTTIEQYKEVIIEEFAPKKIKIIIIFNNTKPTQTIK